MLATVTTGPARTIWDDHGDPGVRPARLGIQAKPGRGDAIGVANCVAEVRKRLSDGRRPVPGLLREDTFCESAGNIILKHNLIQALLKNATLPAEDLCLLGEDA
jgi:hypothetical protein